MKPVFALDLDQDSVTLLRRSAEGWLCVGRVDLGAGTVEADLAALRGKAEALEPDGFATKLILPPSQILYTTVEVPDGDRASRRAAIAVALEGQTPYAVSELVFDFTRSGATARVAVVARETLDEAEGFAEAYGFRPICFVAAPKGTAFAGEPFFGLTSVAGAHVSEGEKLDRDQDPVRVVGDFVDVAASEAEQAPPAAEASEVAEPETPEPEVAPEPEAAPEPEVAVEPEVAADAPVEAETTEAEDAAREEEPETPLAEVEPEPDAPAADLPETDAETLAVADRTVLADTVPEPAADEAPFIAVEDPEPPVAPGPQSVLAAGLPVETADEPAPSFQTRRAPAANWPDDEEDLRSAENRLHLSPDGPDPAAPVIRRIEGASAITAPDLAVPETSDLPEDASNATTRRAGRLGRTVLDTIPDAAHGTQAQQKIRRAAEVPALTAVPEPAADAPPVAAPVRNTTSAPGPAPAPSRSMAADGQPGARGRMLMMLSGGLVFLMLAIGLGARLIGGGDEAVPTTEIAEPAPATAPETVAEAPVDVAAPPSDMATDEPDAAPAEEPASPTISATDAAIADALGEPVPVTDGTETPADPAPEPEIAPPAAVAVTPPAASPEPQADSIGAPPIAQAAPGPDEATAPVALPDATSTAADAPPARQPVPPPAGTVVEFGADGLIVAKPEGVITPGGFTLYSGPPPVVPPLRPGTEASPPAEAPATGNDGAALPADPATDTAAATPADPAADAAAAPAPDPAVAGRRPASRPEKVLAAATAARQKADALADAAAAAAKAEAERLASATPQAVASSRRPARRPSDFSAAVAAAVAAAVSSAVTTPTAPAAVAVVAAPAKPEEDIDEPEPVSAMPNLPTSVTVSKQATVKNAVDLGDITLIGVFGSSANRRALVRMPTGRFVKVKVGDRLDGGTVAAIGDNSVSYVKRGKTIVLAMTKKG